MSKSTSHGRPYNRVLAAIRLAALFAFLVGLLYLADPNPIGLVVGFILVVLGESVRFWAAGHLLKTKELVISGPYSYTRNPLYLGRFLILTGLCVAAALPYHANWIVLVIGWGVFFGYYMPRKEKVEPARLSEEHGEPYDRYFRAVPALFPAAKPYDRPADVHWQLDRMLRNREQWMVIGLLAVFAYLGWKTFLA